MLGNRLKQETDGQAGRKSLRLLGAKSMKQKRARDKPGWSGTQHFTQFKLINHCRDLIIIIGHN